MMNKKLRKFISMLSAATMLLSATMTSTGLAEETTETETQAEKATITLAYDSMDDYTWGDTAITLNGGYGWSESWKNGENDYSAKQSTIGGLKNVYGYNGNPTSISRSLSNNISLSEDGVYYINYRAFTSGVYGGFLTGVMLYDENDTVVGKVGVLGNQIYKTNESGQYLDEDENVTTENSKRVLDSEYFTPYIEIGGTKISGEKTQGSQTWFDITAKVTVDADGDDTIELNCNYSGGQSLSGNYSNVSVSLTGELGTGAVSKVANNFGSPSYFNRVRISKEIEGTKELYGKSTVAEDDFMVKEYGYDSSATKGLDGETAFNPSANLGTGWDGQWTLSSESKIPAYWYEGWRGGYLCWYYSGNTLTRKLANPIDFSKDGKYEIRWQSYFSDFGSEIRRGVSLASGDNIVLTLGNSGTKYAIIQNSEVKATSNDNKNGALANYVTEITVNSKGNDTVKFKRYDINAAEPEAWDFEASTLEFGNDVIDNVKLCWYAGGAKNISIESNAVTAIREETANGEKIYIDYVTPLKDKPVLKGADVSVVTDSDGLVHSAIVEYDKTNSAIYANKENAIAIGDTKIPVSLFDEEEYPINALSQTATAISEDFMAYDMSTAVSELNGGKGWSGAWQNTSAWSLSQNQKSLWASWQQSINRNLANTLDFSQKGEYDIEFVYAMQQLQPKVAYLQFKDENGSELLRLGVKMGMKADGNAIASGDINVLTNTKAYVKIGSQEEKVSDETLYQREGNYSAVDNSLYKLIAKIIVNGNGQDIIKIKAYKLGESVPTDWSYVSGNVDLSEVKASNIGFYNGNIGGIASLEIKKPVASYRKAGDNVYMFFNSECVENNSFAIAVGVNENGNMLTDVKRYDKWEDFSFSFSSSDAKARIFIWDGNMKPCTDFIEIAK